MKTELKLSGRKNSNIQTAFDFDSSWKIKIHAELICVSGGVSSPKEIIGYLIVL
jgi:hypothetical protein